MTRALTLGLVVLLLGGTTRLSANAPPGRYTITADTVRDNATSLMWQRKLEDKKFTSRALASAYCDALVLAGFSNWRLPNLVELVSLVDDTRNSPAIDRVAFPNIDWLTWTSTVSATDSSAAYIVNFNFGNAGVLRIVDNPPFALCVR